MIKQFYIIPRIGGVAYLNMPKSACSTVNIALSKMRREEDFKPPRKKLPDGSSPIHGFNPPHAHIDYFFRRWPISLPPLPDKFIKFTFVRNPYDRILSFYRSKIVTRQTPGQYYDKFGIKSNNSFAEFIETLTSLDPFELEHHAVPQSIILYDNGKLLTDFVGKVEAFDVDWPVIQKLTGFDLELEHANRTNGHGKPAFTEDVRQRIFDYYRDDFELFSYSKDIRKPGENLAAEPMKSTLFTAHLLDRIKLERLKSDIHKRSNDVRRIARTFKKNPQTRNVYFKNQSELFNELIMKQSFNLESQLKDLKFKIEKNKILKLHKIFKKTALANFSKARKRFHNRLYRIWYYRGCKESKIVRDSGLVDAAYYFTTYPDTIKIGISAVDHYVRFGVQEGRNPSANFNTVEYLIEHPIVVIYGLNPLAHFMAPRHRELK